MSGQHLRSRDRSGLRLVRWLLLALVVGIVAGAGTTIVLDSVEDDESVVGESAPTTVSGVAGLDVQPGPIVLAFVGDINVERGLADRLADDPDGFVGPFAPVLREADLAVGNLEAALTTGGAPLDKEYAFRAPPQILDALAAGGIDVVSVANNHGMDYGPEGFRETLVIARSHPTGMVIGAGANEDEAYAPFVRDIGGHRVAVIAATQVIGAEFIASWTAREDEPGLASAKRVDRLVQEVRSARDAADTVVVYLHWGVETETCPSRSQEELADALVAAGADVVVGTHAHRVQGGGMLGEAVVHFGLGNFLFGATSPEAAETGVFLVTIDGRDVIDYEWVPGRIVDRVPRRLDGAEVDATVEGWFERRSCTDLTAS